MSSSVIDLYDRLRTAPDDETRARIIAEAFGTLEERYPHLGDMATRTNLSETELRLIKEIEQLRGDVSKEIEQLRADLKETELRLVKEIERLRGDLRKEIEHVRSELKVELARGHTAWLKWSFLFWLTQFSAILLLLWRVWPGQ